MLIYNKVFIKAIVCCRCSFLQAQKNWFCPLLFKDFPRGVAITEWYRCVYAYYDSHHTWLVYGVFHPVFSLFFNLVVTFWNSTCLTSIIRLSFSSWAIRLLAYSARRSASLEATSRPNCWMSFRCRSASYPDTKIGDDLPESHGEGSLSLIWSKCWKKN